MRRRKQYKREGLPKYVYRKKGNVLYFERKGEPSIKFQCQDHHQNEFMLEYAIFLTGRKQRLKKQLRVRNMNALIKSYIESNGYRNLKPDTAKGYDEVLVYLQKEFGEVHVNEWRRSIVIQLQESLGDRQHFSNYVVVILRILFERAIDIGWLENNPARGVKLTKSQKPPRKPWPDNLITAYRQVATGRELLLFEMCLATGQRVQDVLDMKWTDIRPIDGTVCVSLVQNKTGKALSIPLRDSIVALLANTKRINEYILTNRYGRGKWSYRGAAQAVKAIRQQIGADAYDIHCLRYTAACDLALAGLDDETIGAVTGQSLATVQHYTKSVRQFANAKRAIMAREKMLLENKL